MNFKSSDWKKDFLSKIHQLRRQRVLTPRQIQALEKAESFALSLGSEIPEPNSEINLRLDHVKFSWDVREAGYRLSVYLHSHTNVVDKLAWVNTIFTPREQQETRWKSIQLSLRTN